MVNLQPDGVDTQKSSSLSKSAFHFLATTWQQIQKTRTNQKPLFQITLEHSVIQDYKEWKVWVDVYDCRVATKDYFKHWLLTIRWPLPSATSMSKIGHKIHSPCSVDKYNPKLSLSLCCDSTVWVSHIKRVVALCISLPLLYLTKEHWETQRGNFEPKRPLFWNEPTWAG